MFFMLFLTALDQELSFLIDGVNSALVIVKDRPLKILGINFMIIAYERPYVEY